MERYITKPWNGSLFHVFTADGRSLCGKALMLTVIADLIEPVLDQVYQKGQDCKSCFRKAGLRLEAGDADAAAHEMPEVLR